MDGWAAVTGRTAFALNRVGGTGSGWAITTVYEGGKGGDVARIKIAYIGGGSTRGAGTMASFIEQGENFAGSEIVLIDLDAERLELIRDAGRAHGRGRGRRSRRFGDDRPARGARRLRRGAHELPAGRLRGARARRADPARHGVIGQETQGPGGFFMALRSIT